jgi:hypothetical protein
MNMLPFFKAKAIDASGYQMLGTHCYLTLTNIKLNPIKPHYIRVQVAAACEEMYRFLT